MSILLQTYSEKIAQPLKCEDIIISHYFLALAVEAEFEQLSLFSDANSETLIQSNFDQVNFSTTAPVVVASIGKIT